MSARRAGFGLAALAVLLCACGGPQAAPANAGAWHSVRLGGVTEVVAATAYEGQLLVAVAGERRLFVVERSALVEGGHPHARPMPVEITRDAVLEGHGVGRDGDQLGAQGYRLGLLWDQPLEVVGLAARRLPARGTGGDFESIYLLERRYGVVWWGRLLRDAVGRLESVRLQAAFAVPERPRAGSERLDWRDSGSGLAGLALAPGGDDDLVVVERKGLGASGPRIERLDRFGQSQERFQADLGATLPGDGANRGEREVRALSTAAERYVLLLGEGRGVLTSLGEPGRAGQALAGEPVPTPEIEGVHRWRTLTHAADGVLYLVGEGPATVVAWRGPPRGP